MPDTLGGTHLTIDWLVDVLNKSINHEKEPEKLKDWTDCLIATGDGFMSHIIRVELTWEHRDTLLPNAVVIKTPTLDKVGKLMEYMTDTKFNDTTEVKELFSKNLPTSHKTECVMYSMFHDTTSPLPIPKVYHTEEYSEGIPGTIVMEDLSRRGTLVNMGDGLNEEQMYSLVEAIVDLHLYSIQHKGEWEAKIPHIGKDSIKGLVPMVKAAYTKLTKRKPEFFPPEKLTQIEPLIDDMLGGSYPDNDSDRDSLDNPNLPVVIVHGDMWCANMIFEKPESGKPVTKLLAMVDWQNSRPGNICVDLNRLLTHSCPSELRRNHTRKVLEFYVEKLEEKLGKKLDFGVDEVFEQYRGMMPLNVSLMILQVPLLINSTILDGQNKAERIENELVRVIDCIDDLIEMCL